MTNKLNAAIRVFKRQFLYETLAAHRGNQCKAAEALGVHRNTVRRALAECGMTAADARRKALSSGDWGKGAADASL